MASLSRSSDDVNTPTKRRAARTTARSARDGIMLRKPTAKTRSVNNADTST